MCDEAAARDEAAAPTLVIDAAAAPALAEGTALPASPPAGVTSPVPPPAVAAISPVTMAELPVEAA